MGRPKGSKNKKTLEKEKALGILQNISEQIPQLETNKLAKLDAALKPVAKDFVNSINAENEEM
jgi:hypothetical protein